MESNSTSTTGGPNSGTGTSGSSISSSGGGGGGDNGPAAAAAELVRGGSSGSGVSPPGEGGGIAGQIGNKLNSGQQQISPTQSEKSSTGGSKEQSGDNSGGDNLFKNGVTDLGESIVLLVYLVTCGGGEFRMNMIHFS